MRINSWLATAATVVFVTGMVVQGHENDPKRNPLPPVYGEILHGSPDGDGTVAGFASEGMIFASQVPINQMGGSGNGSDLWGYTSPSGREYAIMTTNGSCSFIEVTDPYNPDFIYSYDRGGTSSLWGDVKVIGAYAYLVGESGGSIKIFNMSNIDSGSVSYIGESTSDGTAASHNIASCPDAFLLARCGGGSNGIRWYSTQSNPASPDYLGAFQDIYVHDAQIALYPQDGPDAAYRGHVIGFLNGGYNGGGTDTSLWVVDFGTPGGGFNASGVVLDTVTWPGAGYSHQGWADDGFNFYWSNDETANNNTHQVVNISDLNNISLVGTFSDNSLSASNHNNYWHQGRLYASNYTSGLRVFETKFNGTYEEVAYFDTFPGSDSSGYDGSWSCYPYFDSGTIIVSDFQSGLFVLKLDLSPVGISYPSGIPSELGTSGGSIDVAVAIEGGLTIDEVVMDYSFASGATGSTQAVPNSGGTFTATVPGTSNCPDEVSVEFAVLLTNGDSYTDNAGPYTIVMTDGFQVEIAWNGNSSTGWSLGATGDSATDGQWDRGAPVGGGDRGDPADDCDGSNQCFLTDNEDDNSDVDGGITTLITPAFDATSITDAMFGYCRWYSNDFGGDPNNDSMLIQISNNGGSSWTLLEEVTQNAGTWVQADFRISDYVSPTNNMRVQFIARDLNDGSVVEAAIDNIEVFGIVCEDTCAVGDFNCDGFIDGSDLGILLGIFGSNNPDGDLNGDGFSDGGDIGYLLAVWTG